MGTYREISIGALKYMDVFSVVDEKKYMFLYYDENDFSDPVRCVEIEKAKDCKSIGELPILHLATTCDKVKLYGRIYNS